MKREKFGADYQLNEDVQMQKNPLTGKCTKNVIFLTNLFINNSLL